MKTPSTPEQLKQINEMFDHLTELMSSLAARWQDEKQYEDIKEYQARIQSDLPTGFTIIKMKKSPFGFVFTIPNSNAQYQITMGATKYYWKRIL